MLPAVDLDNQVCLEANEVREEGPERLLPAKLEAGEAPISKMTPQQTLRVRRVAPQLASATQRVFEIGLSAVASLRHRKSYGRSRVRLASGVRTAWQRVGS